MLSLIEVKCPHCGAQGQIMLPPLGAIIVGPCPECAEVVVVFCGRVLALNKDIMAKGSVTEKKDHLLDVLGFFLEDRVDRLFSASENDDDISKSLSEDLGTHDLEGDIHHKPGQIHITVQESQEIIESISPEELKSFVNVDLKMLDNKDYFKSIFGK